MKNCVPNPDFRNPNLPLISTYSYFLKAFSKKSVWYQYKLHNRNEILTRNLSISLHFFIHLITRNAEKLLKMKFSTQLFNLIVLFIRLKMAYSSIYVPI